MRRGTSHQDPTLYTHDEAAEEEGEHVIESVRYTRAPSHALSYESSSHFTIPAPYSTSGTSLSSGPSGARGQAIPTAIFSQFVHRYRRDAANEEASREDPDAHYFHRGLGQLVDPSADSDDDRADEFADTAPVVIEDNDESVPADKRRERLEWHSMLQSVMDGDVLRSEKNRVLVLMDHSEQARHERQLALWTGLRAKLSGRKEDAERKMIEECRMRFVDPLISEILNFSIPKPPKDAEGDDDQMSDADVESPLPVVYNLLLRWEGVVALYPTSRALQVDKPACAQEDFESRLAALTTWWNLSTMLSHQLVTLQKWTSSETLDVYAPAPVRERQILARASSTNGRQQQEHSETFVDVILKEDTLKRRFEKGALPAIHSFITTARGALIEHASLFEVMGLPAFDRQLGLLASFPLRLMQASLRIQIKNVQMRDPDIMAIDQLTEDLKFGLGLSCTLKREYLSTTEPDPNGHWKLPPILPDDYDNNVLEALRCLFKLIYLKLKSGEKSIYFKETDIIESHWPHFDLVSETITDGSSFVAEQLW